MISAEHTNEALVYIGPPGSGLGMKLGGIDVIEVSNQIELLSAIRRCKGEGHYKIIFADEQLAAGNLADIAELNADPLPAIVLLPNPSAPKNLGQVELNSLVVRAVGSDIFNS